MRKYLKKREGGGPGGSVIAPSLNRLFYLRIFDSMLKFTLRRARHEDLERLDRIHSQNMKGYVERVYPWQPELFREHFVPEEFTVVELAGTVVGFIKVVLGEDIYLGEIQVKPEYQNQGIGTRLLGLIIQESERNNKRLWLKVIKGNPAVNFYTKLGFEVFAESETHHSMERMPNAAVDSNTR
ncbi:MAG: GNAT family N-acetyltransferase [Cyanophyceae cyanobacterium]